MNPVFANSIAPSALLGFGFGSGWLLWFLAAGAAPVIIHLWNKRRHREIRWAAMQYLLAAIRNTSRRITIEQLVLLRIRTQADVVVAFAVAEPYLNAQEGIGGV